MGLGGIGIQCYRLAGSRARTRISFLRRHRAVFPQQIVGIGQSHIGCRIGWIVNDCLGKEIHCLVEIVGRALFKIVTALEIKILRLGIRDVRCGERILEAGLAMTKGVNQKRTDDHSQRQDWPAAILESVGGGWKSVAVTADGTESATLIVSDSAGYEPSRRSPTEARPEGFSAAGSATSRA